MNSWGTAHGAARCRLYGATDRRNPRNQSQLMPCPRRQDWTERSRDLSRCSARAGTRRSCGICHALRAHQLASVRAWCCVSTATAPRPKTSCRRCTSTSGARRSSFDAAQSQPLTWLTSIARNRAIDSLRRAQTQPQLQSPARGRRRRGRRRVRHRGRRCARPARSAEPGRRTRVRSAAAWTNSARCSGRASRSRSTRACSHAEVAEQMRQPLGTVKSWVRRALLSLKSCLRGAPRECRAPTALPRRSALELGDR